MGFWLKLVLPLYLLGFFGAALVWRSYLVWRRTGTNPYALGGGDNAHDFVGKLFRITLLATAANVLVYVFIPNGIQWLVPVFWLEHPTLVDRGLALLAAALIWVLIAQAQMGSAWRIGIDGQAKLGPVQSGLFAISRNPIFLGMLAMLIGLLLVLPTAVSMAIAVLGTVLIHVQVRLEEEFLARTHGPEYLAYCQRVRRWL